VVDVGCDIIDLAREGLALSAGFVARSTPPFVQLEGLYLIGTADSIRKRLAGKMTF